MTSYRIIIENQLLFEIRRDDSRLPTGFRVGEVIRSAGYSTSYVQVEDDDAPTDLEGCLVEPTFERVVAGDGRWSETRIREHFVAERP